MKTKFLIFVNLLAVFAVSCNQEQQTTSEGVEKQTEIANANRISPMIDQVESININNGLATNCENNILRFPTWEKYYQTIEQLDKMSENYYDNFHLTVPANLTDEQYDAYADQMGFDEDKILKKFEYGLAFCSLRKKIELAETEWLANQGDDDWNEADDPDNDFIEDDTERALLSYGHEVIIGSEERNGQIIYKFTGNGTYIQINNMDLVALQSINAGVIPTNNPNVIVFDNPKPRDCKNTNEFRQYFSISPKTKMKTIDKYTHGTMIGNPKVKAKTKFYRKKRGIWSRGRATILARLSTIAGLECGDGVMPLPRENVQRRHKVKAKWDGIALQSANPGVVDDATYGRHGLPNLYIKNIDLFDGQPN